MHDVLRFWLDRGVDGFRVDVIWHLIKDDRVPRQPAQPRLSPRACGPIDALLPLYTADRPEVHEVIAGDARAWSTSIDERVLIGEIYLPIERLVAYYGEDLRGRASAVQLPADPDCRGTRAASTRADRDVRGGAAGRAAGRTGCSATTTSRASRAGSAPAQARVAAMLLLTLRGTPTLYYGDEIGMRDVPIPPERVQDPCEKNVPGLGLGRDPERTPMQWDAAPDAGFTHRRRPGCRSATTSPSVNVAAQRDDPRSMLTPVPRADRAAPRASRRSRSATTRRSRPRAPVLAYRRRHAGR